MSKVEHNELAPQSAFQLQRPIPTGTVWGYFRYSDDRLQKEDSIAQQLLACREGAKKNGQIIPNDAVFADAGEKGWMESRPELDRMMDLIRTGRAKPTDIYFFDTSRAARNMEFALKLQRFFEFHRVRVHFVSNGMTSGTAGFKIQHAVHALMDEQQCVTIGQNVKRGHLNQLEKGCYAMPRVFGYDHVDDDESRAYESQGRRSVGRRLAINPAEAEIVKLIFRLYLSGLGFAAVATELNRRGITSPRPPRKNAQRAWRTGAVRTILTNPKYTGHVRYGVIEARRNPETSRVVNVRRPESEVKHYYDEKIRIISDEDFQAVERLRSSRDSLGEKRKIAGFNKARGVYPWSGLLVCGRCGGLMNICQPDTYICLTAYRGGNCTNRQKLNRDSFQVAMAAFLSRTLRETTTVEELVQPLLQEIRHQQEEERKLVQSRRNQRETVETKLAKVQRSLDAIVLAFERNPASDTLANRLAQLEMEKAILVKQVHEAQVEVGTAPNQEEVRVYIESALEELDAILLGDLERFRDQLRARVKSVILTPVVYEGQPAWELTGDLKLFGGHQQKMVERMTPVTAQHFSPAISLTGITLLVGPRGIVTPIDSAHRGATDDVEALPLAA